MSLKTYLKDIADAIREKTGKTDKINAKDFATEIKNIQSGGGPENIDSLKALLDYTKSTSYMFYNNKTITDLSGYIKKDCTENVTDMSYMFYGCNALTTISEMDTSNVTNMYNMFYNCSKLTTIPELDTGNVTSMYNMFYNCSKLTTIPEIDTSKVTNMSSMFNNCYVLTTIPKINTGNVINMSKMFEGCSALTTIPEIDTSNVTNMSYMFSNCSKLTTISQLDIIKVTNMNYTFNRCSALTNLTLYNIKVNLQIGSGTSYGTLLTQESLVNTCKECVKQSSARTLTVSTTSKTILDSIYVKFTDPSITTIAVDEKGDVEVCESTDTGAMTIAAYMTLKSWTLKA